MVRREVELLEDAYKAGIPVPRQRVVRAVQWCARTNDTDLVARMGELSVRLKPSDRVVRNTMASASAVRGESELRKAVQSMEASGLPHLQPNRATWNTLISAYAKSGERGKALTALDQMQEAGFLPDVVTFNTLIKAHVSASDMGDAESVFELMKARRVKPTERTYNCLIDGFLKQGQHEKAVQFLHEMEGRRIAPTLATLTSFIYANCKANAIEAAQRILYRLTNEGLQPNRITYTAIIEGMARNGLHQHARQVFNEMVDHHGLAPDALTYSSLLKTAVDGQDAWSLYQDMQTRGVIPDARFYCDLIRTQRETADESILNELVDKAIDAGLHIAPTMTVTDCRRLLHFLGTSRPASAVYAWRAMLRKRAKLPLVDRELFDEAQKIIMTTAVDDQIGSEHEAAWRELFGGQTTTQS